MVIHTPGPDSHRADVDSDARGLIRSGLPVAVRGRDGRAASHGDFRQKTLTVLFVRLAYISYVPWKTPDTTDG